jgi:hypothetical protein
MPGADPGLGTLGNVRQELAAEVSGFLLKDATAEELIGAVRGGGRREQVMDPGLAHLASGPGDDPGTAECRRSCHRDGQRDLGDQVELGGRPQCITHTRCAEKTISTS